MAYGTLMLDVPITVVERPLFQRLARDTGDDADHEALADFIARNPSSCENVMETSGVCKPRWRRQGTAKRSSARMVNFHHDPQMPLFLLLVYAKAQRENMTQDEKKQVRAPGTARKQRYGRKG